MPKKFLLIRTACLMEDEGRDDFLGIFPTKEAAIAYAKKHGEGYFHYPSDYAIKEVKDVGP
jgi:hypothetical protein